jgi:hypothetical protein
MSRLEAAKQRLPKAPERANFNDDESFEEAHGYWQSHVGRILGLVARQERLLQARDESSKRNSE